MRKKNKRIKRKPRKRNKHNKFASDKLEFDSLILETTYNKFITRGIGLFVFVNFCVAIYGSWMDFIPTTPWKILNVNVSMITALIAGLLLFIAFVSKLIPIPHDYRLPKSLSLFLTPVVTIVFFWIAFSQGFPAIYTQIVGNENQRPIHVYTQEEYDAENDTTEYMIKGDIIDNAFPSYICITYEDYIELPERFFVKLVGVESGLGFYVKRVIVLHSQFPDRELEVGC